MNQPLLPHGQPKPGGVGWDGYDVDDVTGFEVVDEDVLTGFVVVELLVTGLVVLVTDEDLLVMVVT